MSRLGIKYDGCKATVDDLKIISNSKYTDLVSDLNDVLITAKGLTYAPDTSGVSNSISKAEEYKQKIINFANGLDSYAESIYTFDNGFYNNFVKLDGTNSENYKINIKENEISDNEVEQILLSDANSLEALLYKLSKALKEDLGKDDDSLINEIKEKIEGFVLSDENPRALKYLLRGNSFKIMGKRGEDIFIKLEKSGLDPSDLERCARYMHEELNVLNEGQLNNILSGRNTKNINKLKNFLQERSVKMELKYMMQREISSLNMRRNFLRETVLI